MLYEVITVDRLDAFFEILFAALELFDLFDDLLELLCLGLLDLDFGRITSYNVCYTKLLRTRTSC